MDNSFDFAANTVSTINTIASQLVTGSNTYIGAVFHNLDGTNTIYLGGSDVLSGGENGFALQNGEMVQWRAEGSLNKLYAVAGGGSNLKLSYILWK